jgi:hypothetical protein
MSGTTTQSAEKVQKRAVRMISGLEGKTYEARLKEVGLLSLEERRRQVDMVQTYKIVTGKDMVKSETWFQSVTVTGRATRSANDPLNVRPQACRLGQGDTSSHNESWKAGTAYLPA